MSVGSTGGLLEREAETEALLRAARSAAGGRGAALCIHGEPGVGKTALLDVASARAAEAGLTVLAATGYALEQQFAMGIVRQLFFAALHDMDPAERHGAFSGAAGLAAPVLGWAAGDDSPAGSDSGEAAMYGLLWLAITLAERAPLWLSVDDAHWGDDSSLAWLRYLTRRLGDAPIALVIAGRTETSAGRWMESNRETGVETLELLSLTRGSVAHALRARFGQAPDEPFVAACHELTGGNPFLVTEVAGVMEAEGLRPTVADAGRLVTLAPHRVARSVATRIDRLSADASALARAAAVLGGDGKLGAAVSLAGLDEASAARAVDELLAARIVREASGGFVHPLVQQALYASMPAGALGLEHAKAARVLEAQGEDVETVAAHILMTQPGNVPWAVHPLRRAGAAARTRGVPASAVAYLRRALIEDQPLEARFRLLMELGEAEALAHEPQAFGHLADALSLAPDIERTWRRRSPWASPCS